MVESRKFEKTILIYNNLSILYDVQFQVLKFLPISLFHKSSHSAFMGGNSCANARLKLCICVYKYKYIFKKSKCLEGVKNYLTSTLLIIT